MNQTLSTVSDLAFEAALAGYIVAFVCYAVELASRRGRDATPAEQASAARRAARRAGGTDTLTRPDQVVGHIQGPARPGWGERFGRAAVLVTVIAAVANVVSIVTRGLAVGRLPLGNMYEFTSAICALAVVVWLIVLARTGARSLGVVVMLPVTVLAGVAFSALYVPAAPVVPALNSYWKWIHVSTVAISSSVLMVSGAASVLYLVRRRADARAANGTGGGLGDRLPSLATLDRIAYRTAIIGFPLFTFAVIAGALWAEVAWGRYWGWDPKETGAFITWIVYAAYLHARSTAGWRGARSAWISVIGFATIIFNLFFINMVVAGLHSYAGLN